MESFANRSWNYVALGYGHDVSYWKEFFTVVKMTGYEGPVVLEMEDLAMERIRAGKATYAVEGRSGRVGG